METVIDSTSFSISNVGKLVTEIRLLKQRIRQLNNQLDDAERLPSVQLSRILNELKETQGTLMDLLKRFEERVEKDK